MEKLVGGPGESGIKGEWIGHAEKLWRFLDDLAEKDPAEYKQFIDKQAELAGVKKTSASGTADGDAPTTSSPQERPPFVIMTNLVHPVDQKPDLRPHNVAISLWRRKRGDGDVTYKNGDPVPCSKLPCMKQWADVRVPMRNRKEPFRSLQGGKGFMVYEVEVASSMIDNALKQANQGLREVLIEFAMQHVELRNRVKLNRTGRKLMISRGEASDAEVKQFDKEQLRARSQKAAEGTSASCLPGSLLDELSTLSLNTEKDPQNSHQDDFEAKFDFFGEKKTMANRKPLIQELN